MYPVGETQDPLSRLILHIVAPELTLCGYKSSSFSEEGLIFSLRVHVLIIVNACGTIFNCACAT